MALRCGIVGLPNVGKSTLFNALTAAKALAANYPFATKEPNVGIITVPDPRLDVLAETGQSSEGHSYNGGDRGYRRSYSRSQQGGRLGQSVPCQYQRSGCDHARREVLSG